ncbi:KilA-N domain-containing protein [Cobetia marina]|uniref:KilA-N domain-containing protein n=1 Tax=Cobetia marina TaxID=28258 RepID=UPI00384D5AA4
MTNVIPFDYEGQFIRFNTDGWINATDIAKRFGKEPNDWLVQRDSIRYLAALSKALGKGDLLREFNIIKQLDGVRYASKAKMLRLAKKSGLVITKAGSEGGTWLHPKLAVVFARWLDVDFAVWCDLRIDALMRGELSAMQEFEKACRALDDQNAKGSLAGRELASHRWVKPALESRADYWRQELQMALPIDS